MKKLIENLGKTIGSEQVDISEAVKVENNRNVIDRAEGLMDTRIEKLMLDSMSELLKDGFEPDEAKAAILGVIALRMLKKY